MDLMTFGPRLSELTSCYESDKDADGNLPYWPKAPESNTKQFIHGKEHFQSNEYVVLLLMVEGGTYLLMRLLWLPLSIGHRKT